MSKQNKKMAEHISPSFADLSHELLCHILQYLPLKEVLSVAMLCKKLSIAVDMHLRLRKYIDFCEGKLYGYMSPTITDDHMHSLFKKCPHLETVYGLHPLKVERRRLRKRSALTVPGIIEALSLCCNLKAVETSDLRLFEAIMQNLPKIEIIGHFRNRDGVFPPHASQRLKLQPYPRISSLHLIGVEVPELTAMPRLEHLHLQCVRFTKLQPFRAFLAQNLKTFVMKHCMGPTMALRHLSLIIALSSSPSLSRLELVRVPLPGGLFQRAVEDSYRHNGFVNLKTLVISGCKGVMEADVGHLMIVASKKLESISIQPSLTRDSLFVSLSFAQCDFPKLKSIHLGYIDKLNAPEEWSNDFLLSIGLAEEPDTPSSLTDSGMKVISQLFPNIKSMSVSNCPHLMAMDQWSNPNRDEHSWKELTDLTLQRCHCLQLATFALFIAFLPKIEVIILNDMFREPPKGCSHVGLSAGTGLGMSSAVVSNQDEHIAVQGHPHDFELVPEDLGMENEGLGERDFMEVDEEENLDQHIMVLQQEFFDEERRIVPPPVRHREDAEPGDMPRNNPENRIRRELNDDYNVALNIEVMQVSDMENSEPSLEEAEKEVMSSDDEGSQKDVVNKDIAEGSESKCEQKPCSPYPFVPSSDEESDLVIDKKPYKNSEKKKKVVTFEKSCAHSQECRNKCSKGFDPNQPSTSRDGNCLDCSCSTDKSTNESPTESAIGKSSRQENPSVKREVPENSVPDKNEEMSFDCDSDDNLLKDSPINEKPAKSDLDKDVLRGPLTRNRKRAIDGDAKKKNPSPKRCSNSPASHQQPTPSVYKKKESAKAGNSSSMETRQSSRRCREQNQSDASARSDDDPLKDKNNKKHRKCKQKKCDKLCRKHYPLTRSRRNKCIRDGYNAVSQGTQATSADIRRALRKQRNCSSRCRRRACGSSHRRSHNHISARQQFKRRNKRRHAIHHNKGTSTSDPLMEDDAVLTLRLVSETLISFTIISCGISDVIIDHCQSLAHVEVQACRILKMFQMHYCPSLSRLNISQCPKLSLEALIPEVTLLVATRKILVSFEPCMQPYNPAQSEKLVFSKTNLEQSVILFHDFTDSANESLQAAAKESLFMWMEIVQKLYSTSLLAKQKKKRIKSRESRSRYPYGHNLRRIHGAFTLPAEIDPEATMWRYEILTNDHLFASALEDVSWQDGFPAPAENAILYSLIKTEFTEKKLKLRKKMMSFYIPVCRNNRLTE